MPGIAGTAVSFTETSRPTKCAIFVAPSSMFEVRATPILRSYVKGLRSSCDHEAQPPRYTISWHNPDLQHRTVLGPIMPALPTFGAECLVIAAFQTWRRGVAKVGS